MISIMVVRFFNMDKPGKEFEVKVCSLRLQCWKKIEGPFGNIVSMAKQGMVDMF